MTWITASFPSQAFNWPEDIAAIWQDLGEHRRQLGQRADAAQPLGLRPARLHHAPGPARDVDGLQPGGERGQHVVADAVADMVTCAGSHPASAIMRRKNRASGLETFQLAAEPMKSTWNGRVRRKASVSALVLPARPM